VIQARWIAVCVLILHAGAALAADAAEWLVRMSEAVRITNYSGVVVYRSGERLETLRIVHRFENGEIRERLMSMTGDAREIHRRDGEVICILPRERVVTVDRRSQSGASLLPALQPRDLDGIRENYEIRDLGEGRIAGRRCQGVRVEPKDEFRYGYEYWLDRDTGLPLRVTVLDENGQGIEQMMFTEVSFPERIPDEAFESSHDTTSFRTIFQAAERASSGHVARWRATVLPPGFREMMRDVRRGIGEETVEHFLYTDGLATVSVYGAARPVREAVFTGASNMGAMNVHAREVDGHHVTVVGEVPQATVELIGSGLRFDPGPEDSDDDAE
jgi:sigma-E factor negative regulatory protein RseB